EGDQRDPLRHGTLARHEGGQLASDARALEVFAGESMSRAGDAPASPSRPRPSPRRLRSNRTFFDQDQTMHHRKAGRKFGRNTSHRRAMFRNLAGNLVLHERIQTTDTKAKDPLRIPERLLPRA